MTQKFLHKTGQPELLKEINRSQVFELLKTARLVSRAELAKRTGLSRATMSILVDEFLHLGIIRERGSASSTGGRPAILLEFQPDAAFALGACMYDDAWGIAVTRLDGSIHERISIPIDSTRPEIVVENLKQGVTELLSRVDTRRLLPAIGIGSRGLVDIASGIIISASEVGWFDIPIRQMIQDALQMNTFIVNRSKVGVLGELWHEAPNGLKDLIYISIGSGIAAGIVIDEKLYVGANSSSGEVGHITIWPNGPTCTCGNRGCLHKFASGTEMLNRIRELLRSESSELWHQMIGNNPERITPEMLLKAAAQGEPLATQVLAEASEALGIAIASLINLFNPELIVLGGTVGDQAQMMLPAILSEVQKRASTYPHSAVKIRVSTLGVNAGIIGAATLVLQNATDYIFTT